MRVRRAPAGRWPILLLAIGLSATSCSLAPGGDGRETGAASTPGSSASGSVTAPVLGAFHLLLPDPSGSGVVLFSGPPEGVADPDPMVLWRWDGETWTELATEGPAPSSRGFFTATYDPNSDLVVMQGGQTAAGLSDETWTWDGRAWARLDGDGPGERMSASATHDPSTGNVVLYGGNAEDGTIREDTWAWDGEAWSRLSGAGPVPGRWPAAMVGADDGTLLAVGGHQVVDDEVPPALGDTWGWRGGAWTEQPDAGGPGRLVNAQALRHPDLGVLLLGGSDLRAEHGDVWRWTGERWELVGRDLLPPRQAFGVAYDEVRDVVVMTGGVVEPGSTLRHQDVWEWSGDPTERAVRVSARPPA